MKVRQVRFRSGSGSPVRFEMDEKEALRLERAGAEISLLRREVEEARLALEYAQAGLDARYFELTGISEENKFDADNAMRARAHVLGNAAWDFQKSGAVATRSADGRIIIVPGKDC